MNRAKKTGTCFLFIFCLAQLFLFTFQLSAQTAAQSDKVLGRGALKVSLLDEQQMPLPFAAVFLKNAGDSLIYKTTMADDRGLIVFSALKEGIFILEIKMMGYDTFTKSGIRIDLQDLTVDLGKIQLKPAIRMLSAVTIQAQRPFIERRADKVIVNMDNGFNAGASLMEVMDKLPGVRVSPDDQIDLNGQVVQIYIDGKATPLSSDALAGLLKGMSPSSIQKIELIAKPSSKYDAAGSGGIINIIRKRNYKGGLNGNVSGTLGQGKYEKQNGSLNLNYKGDGYNILLNSSYAFSENFLYNTITTAFFDQYGQLSGSRVAQIDNKRKNRNYTPNLGIDLYLSKKTTLSLSAVQGIQFFDKNARSYPLSSGQDLSGRNLFLNNVKSRTDNFSSGMRMIHQVDTRGQELTVDLDYYNYYSNTGNNNTSISNGNMDSRILSFLDQRRNFNVYSAKADYTLPLKNKGSIEAGLKSSYVVSENGNQFTNEVNGAKVPDVAQNDDFRYTEQINAAYINYNRSYKKFSYQLGLRGESTTGNGKQIENNQNFNRNYFQLFPSAYFDFKFNEQNGLNVSLNKRINRPTYENMNPLIRILNENNYLQGNPDLKPSISYNFSTTYSLKNALFITAGYGITEADFTTFSSAYNNTGTITTKPGNTKYTRILSAHVVYAKQLKSWWYVNTGINFNQQTFRGVINDTELKNTGMPGFSASTYDEFHLNKQFSLMLLIRYNGKMEERNTITDQNFAFTTGARQKLFGTKGSLLFAATDLFNTYKSRYVQNSVSIRQIWDNQIESRIFRLTFSYNFGGTIKRTKTSTAADDEKNRTTEKEN